MGLKTRADILKWIDANIRLENERNPQGLRMAPIDVLHSGKADRRNRDIFYVALCRASGLEEELDPLTGYASMDHEEQPAVGKGTLAVRYEGLDTPEYYYQFTLSKIFPGTGATSLCTVGEDSDHNPWNTVFPLEIEEGYYMLTSGTRLADGSVLSHTEFFPVEPNRTTEVPLVMRSADEQLSVLGTMDADRFLSKTGRGYYLLAVLGDRDEPTNHCVRQLEAMVSQLEAWGRPLLMAGPAVGRAMASSTATSLGRLSKLIPIEDSDGSVLEMLTTGVKSDSRQKPVVTICDSFGHIVYFSQGYNTSLAEDLKRVLSKL